MANGNPIKFVTDAQGNKFYPVSITDATVHLYKEDNVDKQKKLSEVIEELKTATTGADAGKADKVTNATAGNFASLDAEGNLADSGKKASDFKTKQAAVNDPTASGNAAAFIDSISQDANGEITVTKKNVQAASASQAGLMSAAHYTKLNALPSNSDLETALAAKADKVASATENNFAGFDSNGNLKDSGKKAGDFATSAQGSKADSAIQSVKVNNSALTPDDNKAVNLAIVTGTENGTIKVNGSAVSVHGLKSAAYTESSAYDAAGAAAAVLGTSGDASTAATVYGVKAYATSLKGTKAAGDTTDETIRGAKDYADNAVTAALQGLAGALIYKGAVNATNGLPTTNYKKGDLYVVSAAGTYAGKACEVGDYLIANKDYASGDAAANVWDAINGENQVENKAAELIIGTAVTVATVDGTNLTVTQVEDTTKLEAVAVGDTTEYADVTALFTA